MSPSHDDELQEIRPDSARLSTREPAGAHTPPTAVATQRQTANAAMLPAFDPYADEDDAEESTAPSRWRRPRVWIAIALVAAIIVAALLAATRPQTTPLAYTQSTVTQGNLALTVSATGPISSGAYNLNFGASGTVTEIDVQSGQQVTAGQTLAKIDATALQDALASAQQQLQSAQASENAAQVSLQDAQDNQGAADATAQDAYALAASPPSGTTPTAQQLQQAQDQLNQAQVQAQNSVNTAQTQVTSAADAVQSAQLSVTTAQHNLANATLTAPVAGEIATINGTVGAATGSGSAGGGTASGSSAASTPFIQLVNLNAIQLTGQVNEADIGSVNVGWPVTFTVQAFSQDTFYGTVSALSPIGQTTSSVVTYPVTVAVDPQSASQARLFPGMTATMTITTQEAIGVTLVPNRAITYARTAARDGHIAAAATQAALAKAQQTLAGDANLASGAAGYVTAYTDGKLIAVPIVTGITDGTNTAVLSGLNPGEQVVTADNQTTSTTTSTTTTSGTNLFGGGRGAGGGGFGGRGGGG